MEGREARLSSGHVRKSVPVILLVDDYLVITRLLEVNFRLVGFRVAAVARGDVALEPARAVPPSAIVLDVMLPGLGGYEVCRQMRLIREPRRRPRGVPDRALPRRGTGREGRAGTGGLRQQALRARRPGRARAPTGRGAARAVIEERLLELVRAALEVAAGSSVSRVTCPNPSYFPTKQKAHGDFATNVALVLASKAGRGTRARWPRRSVRRSRRHRSSNASRSPVPGFLNLFVTDAWLHQALREVASRGSSLWAPAALERSRGSRWSSSVPTPRVR